MSIQLTTGLIILTLGLLFIARPTLIVRWLIAPLLPSLIFCGRVDHKSLALTIDDGPSGEGSNLLLALLKRHRVPATFFLIGSHLQDVDGFAWHVVDQGHAAGHHMLVDSRSACLDQGTFTAQFTLTEELIKQQLPQHVSLKWFRPGGGWFHGKMINWVAQRGYKLVLGSIFPWDTFHPPAWFLRAFLLCNAHPGGIIVMHDRPDTINATIATLEEVLPKLKQRGFHFVSLESLLES
jgi:peptidoglycan-N-acetylglucosamine deacetylase